MNKIVLYTTGCKNCEILKKFLISKNVLFYEITNIEEIEKVALENKITSVPILSIGNEFFNFTKALAKIKEM